jgi:hypothetical protein
MGDYSSPSNSYGEREVMVLNFLILISELLVRSRRLGIDILHFSAPLDIHTYIDLATLISKSV